MGWQLPWKIYAINLTGSLQTYGLPPTTTAGAARVGGDEDHAEPERRDDVADGQLHSSSAVFELATVMRTIPAVGSPTIVVVTRPLIYARRATQRTLAFVSGS